MKCKNFRIKSLMDYNLLIKNKIYNVIDGQIELDDNLSIIIFNSVEDINNFLGRKQFELYEEEENMFTKDNIKMFSVIKTRNGDLYLLTEHDNEKVFVEICYDKCDGFLSFEWYTKDLKRDDNEFDIVKVYEPKTKYSFKKVMCDRDLLRHYNLIWEGNKLNKTHFTLNEIAKLANIDVKDLKIVK